MTDLHSQGNPSSNPYFKDRRIRRLLIRYGFINRRGDILPSSSSSNAQLARRRTKEAIAVTADGEPIRQTVIENQPKQLHQSDDIRLARRAKSARHLSRNLRNRSARRSAKSKSPEKPRCRIIMTYFGPQTNIEYDKSWFQEKGDEIVVMQQHCGGENLTVFKGFVKPQEKFAFDSKRHEDYPFALALYINGLIDCRVSVCCEYKHKKNVPLGGPSGLFAISGVQKVKPCRMCRFERLKKSKSTNSLGQGPDRYRRSVMPQISVRHSTPPPDPPAEIHSPRSSSTQNGHPTSSSPPPSTEEDRKKPDKPVLTPARSPSISRTSITHHEDDDKRPPISTAIRHPPVVPIGHSISKESPDVSRSPPPSLEADDKKPSMYSTKHGSSVVKKTYKQKLRSPAASLTSSADDEIRKPRILSAKPRKPIVLTGRSARDESPDLSRTPSPTLDADDKRPSISSAKHRSPVVTTRDIARDENSDSSGTSTPTLDADDKRPPMSAAKRSSPVVTKGFTSSIQSPVISQTNNKDTGNYEPDFSESNDDDYRPSSSRYGRPRISDSHLSDKDQGDNNNRQKILLKRPESSDSTDEQMNRPSLQILNGKKNTNVHSRKSSSSSSRKVGPSEDENDQYTPRRLNGENKVADDTKSSSSFDKMKSELNTKPTIEENRRVSSSSTEDFFGIKRSSTKERNTTTQNLGADWFESNSRNESDDNDQSNLNPPSKTKAWEKILFDD